MADKKMSELTTLIAPNFVYGIKDGASAKFEPERVLWLQDADRGSEDALRLVGGFYNTSYGQTVFVAGGHGALDAGSVQIVGGNGDDGIGGDVLIEAGNSDNINGSGNHAAGTIYIRAGNAGGVGAAGNVVLDSLPTSDPNVEGALWVNAGNLKVSAG